jgi:hypothetical protein
VERINDYRASGVDTLLFTMPAVASSEYLYVAGEEILSAFRGTQ